MQNSPANTKVRILNIEINNLTMEELLARFNEGLLLTPNIDHLMKLQRNKSFYDAYQTAKYSVCDSRVIFLLCKLLFPRNPLKAQVTGSDFFPAFCSYHSKRNKQTKVFLLGGTEESVKVAQQKINERTNSNVVVEGYSPPFGFERDDTERSRIIKSINDSGADTLAIGVGAPKQELWVCENREQLPNIKRYLAIGATIEFESGILKRSPKWMTMVGLEWLYRLGQEPRRLAKRYLIEGVPFFLLLLKQRLGWYKNPWAD